MEHTLRNARAVQHILGEQSVITHVVNGENDRNTLHQRIIAVRRPQQHRHQRRLPVMAMNHIRRPDMLRHLDRRAAELRIPLRVVRIIPAAAAIQSVAIEILWIIHKVIAHAIQLRAIGNRGKTQPRPAHWNRQARHHHSTGFRPAVPRQHHRHLVALRYQRLRQRLHHVRQAARLRKRQPLRCYKQNSHALFAARPAIILRYRTPQCPSSRRMRPRSLRWRWWSDRGRCESREATRNPQSRRFPLKEGSNRRKPAPSSKSFFLGKRALSHSIETHKA